MPGQGRAGIKKLPSRNRDESTKRTSRGTTLVPAHRRAPRSECLDRPEGKAGCLRLIEILAPWITGGEPGAPNRAGGYRWKTAAVAATWPTRPIALSAYGSGRIFSLPGCPGSHHARGRWQSMRSGDRHRLTRFHHRLSDDQLSKLNHKWSDRSTEVCSLQAAGVLGDLRRPKHPQRFFSTLHLLRHSLPGSVCAAPRPPGAAAARLPGAGRAAPARSGGSTAGAGRPAPDPVVRSDSSIRPAASLRLIEPYSVPGPSLTLPPVCSTDPLVSPSSSLAHSALENCLAVVTQARGWITAACRLR